MARIGFGFTQSTGYIGSGIGTTPDGQVIAINLITQTGDVFALTVQAANAVTIGFINQAGATFALTVAQNVALGFIDRTAVVYSPVITGGVVNTGGADDIRRFLVFGFPL